MMKKIVCAFAIGLLVSNACMDAGANGYPSSTRSMPGDSHIHTEKQPQQYPSVDIKYRKESPRGNLQAGWLSDCMSHLSSGLAKASKPILGALAAVGAAGAAIVMTCLGKSQHSDDDAR